MKKKFLISFPLLIFVLIVAISSFSFLCLQQDSIIATKLVNSAELEEQTIVKLVNTIQTTYNQNGIVAKRTKLLHDFLGNEFQLIECEPTGYMIYSDEFNEPLEYSAESMSPYIGYNDNIFYTGAAGFYVFENGNYRHLITNQILSKETESEIIVQSENLRYNLLKTNLASPASTTQTAGGKTFTCVNNSDYFALMSTADKMGYWNGGTNSDGVCGYIAAAILLGYCDTANNVIASNYFYSPTNGTQKYFLNNDFVKLLRNNYGTQDSSTSSVIRVVLNKYFSAKGIKGLNVYDMITPFFSGTSLKNYISRNQPVILFGSLYSNLHNKKINHAAVVYGYVRGGIGANIWGFLAHFGWDGYSKVTVNVNSSSTFGSMLILNDER